VLKVLAQPGETGPEGNKLDAGLACCPLFTIVGGFRLDERQHADLHTAAPGSKQHAERSRRLSLAVAGVQDREGRALLGWHREQRNKSRSMAEPPKRRDAI